MHYVEKMNQIAAVSKHVSNVFRARIQLIKAYREETGATFSEARSAVDQSNPGLKAAYETAKIHSRLLNRKIDDSSAPGFANRIDGRVEDCDECHGSHENGTLFFARGATGRVCHVLCGCPRDDNGSLEQVERWAGSVTGGYLDF